MEDLQAHLLAYVGTQVAEMGNGLRELKIKA
jgi:hypothetical protein